MRKLRVTSLFIIVAVTLAAFIATIVSGNSPELGLDLQGGASVVLSPKDEVDSGQLDQAQEIIRNRVDGLGVAEPDIHREGGNIVVQLPGVKNARRALDLVGQTAELRFRAVLQTYAPPPPGAVPTPSSVPESTTTTAPGDTTTTSAPADGSGEQSLRQLPLEVDPHVGGLAAGELAAPLQADETTTTTGGEATTTTTTEPAATTTTVPDEEFDSSCGDMTTQRDEETAEGIAYFPEKDADGNVLQCYILGPTKLTGRAVTSARAELDQNGQWVVNLDLSGEGLALFNAIAGPCYNGDEIECPTKMLGIVLDGNVQSAPEIQQPQFDNQGVQISGGQAGFRESEAKDLALVLRYGSLPVELEPQTVQTVSATLGKDSLRAGLIAGLGGLVLVALYIIMYYRALGLVVVLGMFLWGALNYSIITFLSTQSGLALTLAGVTGVVVSVGVTVDSYVVYFERLKDEIRAGRTIRSSVDRAFKRAFRTILAADISSFIGAALLYWLTVGSVRGFAFFLGLSTILDVVIAYMFKRPLVALLARSRFFTEARWVGVARGLGEPSRPAIAPVSGGQ